MPPDEPGRGEAAGPRRRLSRVLGAIPVGTAYAIWAGGGIVLVALAAWAVYGQTPDAAGFLGIGLIVAGVLVLNLLSKTSPH